MGYVKEAKTIVPCNHSSTVLVSHAAHLFTEVCVSVIY